MTFNFSPIPTMDSVARFIENVRGLPDPKRTELLGALNSVERLAAISLAEIPATVEGARSAFAMIQPQAHGISKKRFQNIKSSVLSALHEAETGKGPLAGRARKRPDCPEWAALSNKLRQPRQWNAVSRLATFCRKNRLKPKQVNTAVIKAVMADMGATSLRPNQYQVERTMARTWNEICDLFPELGLQKVDVLPSRLRRTRVPLDQLSPSLIEDWHAFSRQSQGDDVFADEARRFPLKQNTLNTMFGRIHGAINLLVMAGWQVERISSLADLVSVEAFRVILLKLSEKYEGRSSYEGFFTATGLIQIAERWVKVDVDQVGWMKAALIAKLGRPEFGMAPRNDALLAKFDDPVVEARFLTAGDRIWEDVMSRRSKGRLRLAEAQAALAITFLTFMPMRLHNLAGLAFEEHLHLKHSGRSIVVIPEAETKSHTKIQFEIPTILVERLLHYREVIAPDVIGHKPTYLFANADGSKKHLATVRYLIQRYVKLFVGIHMNPHVFRHLAAKFILEQSPGAYSTVQHLLGHKKLSTTETFYTGHKSKRAGLHHARLMETAIAEARTVSLKNARLSAREGHAR